jgi:hypothetical protein
MRKRRGERIEGWTVHDKGVEIEIKRSSAERGDGITKF